MASPQVTSLTQIDVAGEEAVRLLAVDVGVVGVGRLEGRRRVGQEVVEERTLLAPQHVARQRPEVLQGGQFNGILKSPKKSAQESN